MSHQSQRVNFHVSLRAAVSALVIVFVQIVAATTAAQGQTFKIIYSFTGGQDGEGPESGLVRDNFGNMYGTTELRGSGGHGTVFKFRNTGSGWVLSPLYEFAGGAAEGGFPLGVTVGPDGTLYGTTLYGGNDFCDNGCGVVFHLKPPLTPPKSVLSPWKEDFPHMFDGGYTPSSNVIFGPSGEMYGATDTTIYELVPTSGGWNLNTLYTFKNLPDGYMPTNVALDDAGDLYGTTARGGNSGCLPGNGCGTVFKLTHTETGWTKTILYTFQSGADGGLPWGPLVVGPTGRLYGTTTSYGVGGGGTVFELVPSGGGWTFSTLCSFTGGGGPNGSLVPDGKGSYIATTHADGVGDGTVFKFTPSDGGGSCSTVWTSMGEVGFPGDNLVIDANGNIFGTSDGGRNGFIWEITP